jgi:hypothetical protein
MAENIQKNRVKQFREAIPLSVSELARKAGLTTPNNNQNGKRAAHKKEFRIKSRQSIAKVIRGTVLLKRQQNNCPSIYHGDKNGLAL